MKVHFSVFSDKKRCIRSGHFDVAALYLGAGPLGIDCNWLLFGPSGKLAQSASGIMLLMIAAPHIYLRHLSGRASLRINASTVIWVCASTPSVRWSAISLCSSAYWARPYID